MSSSTQRRKSRGGGRAPAAQESRASNRSILLLAALVVAAFFAFSYLEQMNELAAVRAQIEVLEKDVAQAEQRTAELEATLGEVAGPAYVDAAARSELGLIQPGDDPFVVLETDNAGTANPPDAALAPQQSSGDRGGVNLFDPAWWQSLFAR